MHQSSLRHLPEVQEDLALLVVQELQVHHSVQQDPDHPRRNRVVKSCSLKTDEIQLHRNNHVIAQSSKCITNTTKCTRKHISVNFVIEGNEN